MAAVNTIAMAACYSPGPYGEPELPFDLAESREKESMARNAERRKAIAAGGVVSQNSLGFMINGTPVSSPPGAAARPPSAQGPVRVGSSIKTPVKVLDVPAVLLQLP